jgi:hypothetical protein
MTGARVKNTGTGGFVLSCNFTITKLRVGVGVYSFLGFFSNSASFWKSLMGVCGRAQPLIL